MEPITTLEGYQVQQNADQSRSLLSDYYRKQGYTVIAPKTENETEIHRPSAADIAEPVAHQG